MTVDTILDGGRRFVGSLQRGGTAAEVVAVAILPFHRDREIRLGGSQRQHYIHVGIHPGCRIRRPRCRRRAGAAAAASYYNAGDQRCDQTSFQEPPVYNVNKTITRTGRADVDMGIEGSKRSYD